MLPAIAPGDWVLVDPTVRRWPRRGSVVLFREPEGHGLSIKRLAGAPGDVVPFADGFLHLADDEAWLLADATPEEAAAAGFGAPRDSQRFGPVAIDALVGRIWFRYGPPGRPIGPIGRIGPGHPTGPPAAVAQAHETPSPVAAAEPTDGPLAGDA